ncbi:MAG: hypothetical protein HXL13_01315 [Candidatus Nanosynbacter sp.]|nr:hypothetical protein [Candidatus Nanosynbacter sp.]
MVFISSTRSRPLGQADGLINKYAHKNLSSKTSIFTMPVLFFDEKTQ